MTPKLTTIAACRVVGFHRDRFNEHVAAGNFPCAPATVPGRARAFDSYDMEALWLFKDLIDDQMDAERAGYIACTVAKAARENPDALAISFVEYYGRPSAAYAHDAVRPVADWDKSIGAEIRKVTTFRLKIIRAAIAEGIDSERALIGPDD